MTDLFDGRLLYGAAVYPEVWHRDVFASDVAHMRQLGMNTARLGEFMWSTLEPDCGRIDLQPLRDALEILDAQGIAAILCTPTASPPVWFSHDHPERLHHTSGGLALGHGSRQHACTNNSFFRERAAVITRALAEEFGADKRILAWQLDNEFKSHVNGCHCQICRSLWGHWLRNRYQEVSELNRAWSSAIWSETYQSFEQVPLPGPTPFIHNSSLSSAFEVFSREMINNFAAAQSQIIREHSALPITHNSRFGFFLDNQQLFADLDFSSFDTYPAADNYPAFLMNLDFFPHVGASRQTMLMETSTSHGGSISGYGRPHPQGFVEAEIFANFASGSRGFMFWPFRQHSGGSEQPHGAVVSAWGSPTIGHSAAERGGKLLEKMAPLLAAGEPIPNEVAVTYSDRGRYFMATESGGKLDYRSVLSGIHRIFVQAGIPRDLLSESASLAGYKVLFTPYLHHLSEDFLGRVAPWVQAGGTWVVGPGSGDRTAEHAWHVDDGLGGLEDLMGVRVTYSFPATGSETTSQLWEWEGELAGMSTFVDCTTAHPLGTVTGGPAAGSRWVTENSGTSATGAGRVIFVGSLPEPLEMAGQAGVLESIIRYATLEVASIADSAGGSGVVEYQRRSNGSRQRWLVNMSAAATNVTLDAESIDLLTNTLLPAQSHRMEPYTYIVTQERKT